MIPPTRDLRTRTGRSVYTCHQHLETATMTASPTSLWPNKMLENNFNVVVDRHCRL